MRYTEQSIVQDLLAALKKADENREITGYGYINGIGYDGIVLERGERPGEPDRRAIIEVSQQPVVTIAEAEKIRHRFTAIDVEDRRYETHYLYITSGDMTKSAKDLLDGTRVVVRSLRSIEDLKSRFWETLSSEFKDTGLTDRARLLIAALAEVPPGREHYSDYERICCDILQFLFCPELETPVAQTSTANRSQRRDVIMANHAESGFWARMRERYAADYLVAEMKNNRGSVSNTSVWQLAAYLKEKGLGLFGLLIARNGVSRGVNNYAVIDQWLHSQKLVVPLSNDDLVRMIRIRDGEGEPEGHVQRLIDSIRRGV